MDSKTVCIKGPLSSGYSSLKRDSSSCSSCRGGERVGSSAPYPRLKPNFPQLLLKHLPPPAPGLLTSTPYHFPRGNPQPKGDRRAVAGCKPPLLCPAPRTRGQAEVCLFSSSMAGARAPTDSLLRERREMLLHGEEELRRLVAFCLPASTTAYI